ncbi:folate-binding protein [Opitutaceae bacterium EW11]|nr:folate-binding protein [Opitutaceae bacterium EW11]
MNSPSFFASRPSAVLRVTGADAFTFLQGQFTQDLRPENSPRAAYGLWLNQKGKVVADSFALQLGPEWLLVSGSSPVIALRERLEAFIIADDVELSDVTEDWEIGSFWGPDTSEWLRSEGVTLPAEGEWSRLGDGYFFRGRRCLAEHWQWLRPVNSDAAGSFSGLERVRRVEATAFERARIEAGVPMVPADVGPNDLPNEGGLEDEALSYSKGCYLGQEVMARLHHQGQIRRKLVRVRGVERVSGRPALFSAEGKRVGELRSTAVDNDGQGFVGLAMVTLLGLDRTQPLLVEGATAPTISLVEGSE